VLKLDGRIPLSSLGRDVEAFFRIERMDRVGSLLQASVNGHGETRFLKVTYLSMKIGTAFRSSSGSGSPLSLSLSGQGTPDFWRGKLLAGSFPLGRLAAHLEVKDAENPLVKLRGQLLSHP